MTYTTVIDEPWGSSPGWTSFDIWLQKVYGHPVSMATLEKLFFHKISRFRGKIFNNKHRDMLFMSKES